MLTPLAVALALVQPAHAFSGITRPWDRRAASTSAPHLSYHQGRVVGAPRYFAVYWGGYWNTAQGAAERAYYDQQLDTGLRDELAAELTARVLAAEESVRWRRDGHTYFTRTIPGREFEQFCRAGAGGDQVLLDTNLLLDDPGCAGAYVALSAGHRKPARPAGADP